VRGHHYLFPIRHWKDRPGEKVGIVGIGGLGHIGVKLAPRMRADTVEASKRCIPSSRSRRVYRERHKVENLFAKLKDWRRIATRYDRYADAFFSAICNAATVIFWL
jgi:hypothetical protein